jgi:hypothetical protein
VPTYQLIQGESFPGEIVAVGGVHHAHPMSRSMQSYEFGFEKVKSGEYTWLRVRRSYEITYALVIF